MITKTGRSLIIKSGTSYIDIIINQLVPSRIVYLHCKDIPKLRTLYESKGFHLLTDINDDPVMHKTDQEDLLIYLMSMKELKRILEENNLI